MRHDNIVELPIREEKRRRWGIHFPSWRTWMRIVSILILVILSGEIALHVWIERWVKERLLAYTNQDLSQFERIRKFWDIPLEYPVGWLHGSPRSVMVDRAIAECERAEKELDQRDRQAKRKPAIWLRDMELGETLTPEDWKTIQADMNNVGALERAIQKLALALKNEIAKDPRLESILPKVNEEVWNQDAWIQLLKLKSILEQRAGKMREAIDTIMSMFYLVISNPLKDCWFERAKYRRMVQFCLEIEYPLAFIQDPQVLHGWLNELNALNPLLLLNLGDRLDAFAFISDFGSMKRQGLKIEIQLGIQPRELIQPMSSWRRPSYGFPFLIESLLVSTFSDQEQNESQRDELVIATLDPFVFSTSWNEFLLYRVFQGIDPAKVGYDEIRARQALDLLRLRVAGMLYRMETGKKVTATQDLVPTYLAEAVIDPESQKSYEWDANGQVLVSASTRNNP